MNLGLWLHSPLLCQHPKLCPYKAMQDSRLFFFKDPVRHLSGSFFTESPWSPGGLEIPGSQETVIASLREWGSHGVRGPSGEPRSSSTLAGASFTLRRVGLQESRSTHVVPGSRGCLQGLWGHLRRTARVCLNGWRRLQTLSIASTEFL